ncbi:large ribosomal subunit protein mL41-like [Tubulanus polymorphus]|uniref:large ribosomal subunit protein mL41-like n=1 Tax=Tubulanus polymorphus TaxID=672921 RepID=UPI003DA46921
MAFLGSRLPHIQLSKRGVSTGVCLCSKKARIPYDKRFPVTAKHINERKPGGNREFRENWGRRGQAQGGSYPTGYLDDNGKWQEVPEMVPEFIVPDLSDFKLKPYVPYNAPEVVQSEFTAKNLFDATIAKEIKEQFRKGKISIDEIKSQIGKSPQELMTKES